jgi:hypothetical protein
VEVLTLGNVAGWVERPTLFGDCGAEFYHFALWLVTVVASALFIDFFFSRVNQALLPAN